MPAELEKSLRNSLLLVFNVLIFYSNIITCNPLADNVEGSAEEPVSTTTKSPEQLQAEYELKCKERGPFCIEQTYVNIAITILGALVFLISACIAGCVSRRQEANRI